ncbi:hydroxymethylglutaryl-CoA reductase, degradative [Candidatus Micrarchaeota archaeon CG11_big_fil_rev_8_21_14_0_20_47_5]|nr:MAG: hydroxymethylglutaryl-CoA reductase, degradative [Candidatus Micrarchaeota archaeon CG1_02_47_40]PIN83411.1 MAG: hydroxymethylglutaryl-CoA reductase, degradative [Candidatus Micrarchaeota archaeon CG11_big_fil_rev_8_21_14_0_20_47_5]
MANSELSGFYKLSVKERLERIGKEAGLEEGEIAQLNNFGSLSEKCANGMIENVIGTMPLPLGIATNFHINGKDYLIPMAIEEPSVVAAASNAAKLARQSGGFSASCGKSIMRGQIQVVGVKDAKKALLEFGKNKAALLEMAKKNDSGMSNYGGGVQGVEARVIETARGEMVIVEFFIDVCDAMGANSINTMLEALAPEVERVCGGRVRLRILSNLADRRIAKAKAIWKKETLGEAAIEGILEAYEFAANDIYRCATHNKGIMNGVDSVVIASGNDFRAVEAGAHSYAARDGKYVPLTKYWKDEKGDLVGEISLPVAIGIVGGATKVHPVAKIALKILGVKSAGEFGCVLASVGLAQNFAALRALSCEGIQKGHMELAAKNIALTAGAGAGIAEEVAKRMVRQKKISVENAKKIIKEIGEGR